jgi:hypothetical protein
MTPSKEKGKPRGCPAARIKCPRSWPTAHNRNGGSKGLQHECHVIQCSPVDSIVPHAPLATCTEKLAMIFITAAGQWFRTRVADRRVELALALRVIASAVLSLAASHVLHLPIPGDLWDS